MSGRRNLDTALRAYVHGRDRVWVHGRKLGPGVEAETEPEFGNLPSKPRYGVAVPEHLDFQRGPASRRDAGRRIET